MGGSDQTSVFFLKTVSQNDFIFWILVKKTMKATIYFRIYEKLLKFGRVIVKKCFSLSNSIFNFIWSVVGSDRNSKYCSETIRQNDLIFSILIKNYETHIDILWDLWKNIWIWPSYVRTALLYEMSSDPIGLQSISQKL